MRIATWNVNSLRARIEKVIWWIDRTSPDVLLLQETKLADADLPRSVFAERGYEIAHHGQGRWNGVAIASKVGIEDVVVGFGEAPAEPVTEEAGDAQPLAEARFISARCGGVRVACLYAPNGRTVGSTFYEAKLAWYRRLLQWVEARSVDEPLLIGGDFNIAPEDRDVWDAKAAHGGTHVSAPERDLFAKLLSWGLSDGYRLRHDDAERYSWWDYRAGDFYKNVGMRIDHLLVTAPLAERVVAAEIDREARKGKPIPSDHAPVTLDLDEPGKEFDAGWAGAAARIAQRRAASSRKQKA